MGNTGLALFIVRNYCLESDFFSYEINVFQTIAVINFMMSGNAKNIL